MTPTYHPPDWEEMSDYDAAMHALAVLIPLAALLAVPVVWLLESLF